MRLRKWQQHYEQSRFHWVYQQSHAYLFMASHRHTYAPFFRTQSKRPPKVWTPLQNIPQSPKILKANHSTLKMCMCMCVCVLTLIFCSFYYIFCYKYSLPVPHFNTCLLLFVYVYMFDFHSAWNGKHDEHSTSMEICCNNFSFSYIHFMG